MLEFLDRPGLPRLAYRFRPGAGPTLVFLPGYRSDMTGGKANALDRWAEQAGRAMLRFDYRGCGESEGAFGEATLDDWRDDLFDLLDRVTEGPLVLVGSSMGGWLMLLAALELPERIQALVGIAAAPDFTDWGFDDAMRATLEVDGLLVTGEGDADDPQIVTHGFWRSGQANRLLDRTIAFNGPVRLLHGLADTVVPTSIAFRLSRAVRSADVQMLLVKEGDHRLSRDGDLKLLVTTVASLMEAL
jgi:pimeloyl-ACP methyl ester carboxylesterase